MLRRFFTSLCTFVPSLEQSSPSPCIFVASLQQSSPSLCTFVPSLRQSPSLCIFVHHWDNPLLLRALQKRYAQRTSRASLIERGSICVTAGDTITLYPFCINGVDTICVTAGGTICAVSNGTKK